MVSVSVIKMKFAQDSVLNTELDRLFKLEVEIERKSTFFNASMLPICARRVYYSKTEEITDPPSLESLILMKWGEELHQIAYRWMDRLGWYSPIGEDYGYSHPSTNISFKADKFINMGVGQTCIVEVKSIGKWQFIGTKRIPGVTKDGPREADYYQLQIYMNFFKMPGILYYINRENGQWWLIPCEIDEEAFKEMKQRSAMISACLKKGVAPERPHTLIIDKDGLPRTEQQRDKVKYRSDWQCYTGGGWCAWMSLCWGEQGLDPEWRKRLEEKKDG